MASSQTTDKGVIKPQCVICLAVLCPESLKSSQLQKHLRNKHLELADMPKEVFAHKGSQVKKQRRDSLRASLEVAWLIARNLELFSEKPAEETISTKELLRIMLINL
ncbi:SCAN domain-containing protein 3 [Oopsacas minuta]|uniref:SCAN domain-containing protein 3 n=1 Tax=Oopsacas minuta TaxID=111878 RepID=A0AAV7K5X8_9METZ|nr:SCAN domain-containing protein 3 [Oopsacas minuta]